MDVPGNHQRKVHHYHDPGDLHELTFSCYRRLPPLTNSHWCRLLAESVDRAMRGHEFALVAFVFMPEHVHLLVYPRAEARLRAWPRSGIRPGVDAGLVSRRTDNCFNSESMLEARSRAFSPCGA